MSTPDQQPSATGEQAPRATVTEHLPEVRGVVVGDDCSRDARKAVEYAAQEAVRRGCDLHVVRSWNLTSAPRPASWEMGYMPSLVEWEEAVMQDLESTWSDLRDRVPSLHLHPVHRSPKEVLLDASDTADVLVLGARGRGRVAEFVLGSVADEVVRRSLCPVVVVPFRDAED